MEKTSSRGVNNSKPTFPYIVVRFKGLKPIIFCFAPNRGEYVCQHSRYGRLVLRGDWVDLFLQDRPHFKLAYIANYDFSMSGIAKFEELNRLLTHRILKVENPNEF